MDSATSQKLIYRAATFCLILINLIPANSAPSSAYDVLEDFDLPLGLLPKGVMAYDLDPTTGQFAAYLTGNCRLHQANYLVKYKPAIKGFLSNQKLSEIKGVSVMGALWWKDIKEIVKMDDSLIFSVGNKRTALPVEYFDRSPLCENHRARKLGREPIASC